MTKNDWLILSSFLLCVLNATCFVVDIKKNNQVGIMVNGFDVYRGPASCINVRSAGKSTELNIYKCFLTFPIFKIKTYVSDDITVLPVIENEHQR